MILKKLLKSQDLNLIKAFTKQNPGVWDVAVYGSYIRGKEDARDIDIALILSKSFDMGKKIDLAYKLKKLFEKIIPLEVDVKAVDLQDFLDENFLAREGIIAESYLINRKRYLADLLGFKTFAIIKYNLKGLTYSQKKMLYYALKGRRGNEGVLKKLGGEMLSKGILKIPVYAVFPIESLLKLHKLSYNVELVMSYQKYNA
ncbi:nucleotidyltransferase domain-containing protein [Candidatus Woesearchaeota archaeon]|nr:nucleotidyltransferase domain-containing protein [Candidatus Woesearchaeota archaeon]